MKETIFYFIAFGCLGITTEIFFTALSDVVLSIKNRKKINYSLTGHSYIWMFGIYGLVAIFLPPAYDFLANLPLLVRLLIYALAIFIVEFITGWLIEKITGKCPWHYDTTWAVKGYIRLDYLPFWMVFGWIIERVYLFLCNHFVF